MAKKEIKFHLPLPEMLTSEQRNLIKLDLASDERKWWWENLIVQWYWWTWKTVVAYYRALGWERNAYKSYKWNWNKVLVLCFNRLLNSLLKSEKRFPLSCDIFYLQEFYRKIRNTLQNLIESNWWRLEFRWWEFNIWSFTKPWYKADNEKFYIIYSKWWTIIKEEVDPRKKRYFANSQTEAFLTQLFSRYIEYNWWNKIYKEIIIDEWQDISWDMLKSLKILTDHISIFADDHQNTQWGSTLSEMNEILCPNWSAEHLIKCEHLTYIMRTTKEIFEYAAETFLPEDEQVKAMQMAKNCISIPESRPDEDSRIQCNETSRSDWICNLIKKYNEKVENIMVVCPWIDEIKEVCTNLNHEKILHWVYYSNIEYESFCDQLQYAKNQTLQNESLLITTYVSAKWLEAECVIIYISRDEFEKFINWEIWDRSDNIFYTLSVRPRRKLLFVTNFPLSDYENNE